MSRDAMTLRLHLRRIRVVEVAVDQPEQLVLLVEDLRRVVRRAHCGLKTDSFHDRRRMTVSNVSKGHPTTAAVPMR